ncbi:hypothetical protein CP556_10555 [Natrinema sp. CBA1119]|uniref:hypothetical protein n=1 Tax=Natrinema sp. CBA1119 TaxID=1608465 RepID=UPI000BF47709|nr:hypothetical protein [Natrinema sp. CBA1119]PGF16515.1 hypothetical protein CP556_10555 [Natrinema sp. CBA1119]
MSPDREANDDAKSGDRERDDEESSFPDCPRCGKSVLISVALGPHTGSVGPCGCSVPPDLFPDLRGD